jgi:hypothetical protein
VYVDAIVVQSAATGFAGFFARLMGRTSLSHEDRSIPILVGDFLSGSASVCA